MDLVGIDLIHTIQSYLFSALADDKHPQPPIESHLQERALGMKTGRGFYDWQIRSPDDLLERRDRQIVRQLEFLREMNAL